MGIPCPRTTVDFQSYDFNSDPYPTLKGLSALGPVVFHESLNQYLVTNFRDGAKVLGNAAAFKQPVEVFRSMFGGDTMSSMEGDKHKLVRNIWAHSFAGSGLERRREVVTDVVRSQLRPFIDRVRAGETIDAVSVMTSAIPGLVIAHMLGIPTRDHADFCRWSDGIAGLAEAVVNKSARGQELGAMGLQAASALNAYAAHSLASGEHAGADDLIGALVASSGAVGLTEQEKIASITQAVFAGTETTAKLLATALFALSRHPDQRALLRRNPNLIPQAVEEIHRWQTVAQTGWRVAGNNAVVAGVEIAEASAVLILQGIANRDAERWPDPDTFDVRRDRKPHLGFGYGGHTCLGMNLARMELEVWLASLLQALPEWEMTEVDWGQGWGSARGPIKLLVRA